MEKIITFLKEKTWAIVLLFGILSGLQTCSLSNKIATTEKKLSSKNDSLQVEINHLKKEVDINKYETLYEYLYVNNAIVRTKERPDDRMFYYKTKIDSLRKIK